MNCINVSVFADFRFSVPAVYVSVPRQPWRLPQTREGFKSQASEDPGVVRGQWSQISVPTLSTKFTILKLNSKDDQ